MSPNTVPPRRLWWLLAGYGVWCSALVILYALHAIGCAYGWSPGVLRLGLAAVLLAHLAIIGWMWRDLAVASPNPEAGPTGTFLQTVALWTMITALVATVFTLAPALVLAACI